MRLRTMFVLGSGMVEDAAACMVGDPATAVKDFYGGGGAASFHLLRDQLVGHTVVVAVDFYVIVDVYAHSFPLAKAVGLWGKRLQGRTVELAKQIPVISLALFEGAMIQAIEQLGDRLVQGRQIEEGLGDGARR
jgi:hypothetical protein